MLGPADQTMLEASSDGLTKEPLSEKSGVARNHLARLETARQDKTFSTLEKSAKALGVKVGRLLE